MKIRTLSLAGTGTLMLGVAAQGAFTGVAIDSAGTYNDGVTDWTTYNLFVEFDNSGDQLVAVAGSPGTSNVYIASTGAAGFYQDAAFGGDIEHNRLLDGSFAGLANDSFVTIGRNDTSEGGANTTVTPGFTPTQTASFNAGGPLDVSNGSWARTPLEAQTFASNLTTAAGDSAFRVLFAVLTIETSADFDANSSINIQTVEDGVAMLRESVGLGGGPPIPAPGALALLGLAGFAGSRRRRG